MNLDYVLNSPGVDQIATAINNLPNATQAAADNANAAATAANNAVASLGGLVAATYSSSANYAVGDYVYNNNKLYRCTTAITGGEAWTAAHWTAVTVGEEIVELKSALNKMYYQHTDAAKWELGSLGTGSGGNSSSTTRMRTKTYLDRNVVCINPKTGYKFAIFAYAKNNPGTSNFVGIWNGSQYKSSVTWFTDAMNLRVAGDYSYRIIAAKTDDGSLTIETDALNIEFWDSDTNDLSVAGYPADAKAVKDATDEIKADVDKVENMFQQREFLPVDDTYSGMTKYTGKSADSSGLSDSSGYNTYCFTAPDNFKVYITNYNLTYTCLALYSGEPASGTYIGRYRHSSGSDDLPETEQTAVDILEGYTVAITVKDTGGTFKLYQNSDSINGVVLSSNVLLGESQIGQVLDRLDNEKRCKIQYISEAWNENSTARLKIYVPTDNGYVLYNYVHTVKASINADVWRLSYAFSCDDTLQQINALTYSGEWECALHLKNRDYFSGGNAHGDEVQTSQNVWIDGALVDITDLTSLTEFTSLRIIRTSNIYDPSNHVTIIAEHGVEYLIDSNGIQINQSVKWLSAYTITACYLGMFPVAKTDDSTDISSYYYTDRDFNLASIASPINAQINYARKLILTNDDKNIMFSFEGIKCPTKLSNGANRMIISDNGGLNYHKCYDVVNITDADASVSANEYWMSQHKFKISIGDAS